MMFSFLGLPNINFSFGIAILDERDLIYLKSVNWKGSKPAKSFPAGWLVKTMIPRRDYGRDGIQSLPRCPR